MFFPSPKNIRRYLSARDGKDVLKLLPPGNVLARAPSARDLLPVKFIGHEEAIRKITEIKEVLRAQLEKCEFSKFLPTWAFLVALSGESETIGRLNSGGLSVPLAWDERTGLPSSPTLLADAAKSAEFVERKNLRRLLASFREWTLLWEEQIQCGCGGGGGRGNDVRAVDYGVWVNHVLTRENDALLVKQFVAVRSEDELHIKNHYLPYKPSEILDKSNVVWTAINRIRITGEKIEIEDLGVTAAKEIYDQDKPEKFVFWKKFMNIVKSAEAIK